MSVPYRFAVEALGLDGRTLGDYPMPDLDFEPLLRCAHLEAVRSGELEASVRVPPARVDPIACRELGRPYVEGVAVTLDGVAQARDFGLSAFSTDIATGARDLVARGVLSAGEAFDYRLCAFPQDPHDEPAVPVDFELEATDEALSVCRKDHPCTGSRREEAADIPVVLRENVIDEAVALAARGGDVEVGGFLLGKLCRDARADDLFVDVSALLVAEKAIGTETSLRFNPETFAHLQQVLGLRRRDETLVGWFHSHPYFCRQCPPERRRQCVFSQAFFSRADCDVHRSLFPQAYSQALLISDLGADQPSVELFSWRDGVITAREFDVVAAELTVDDGSRIQSEEP